MDNGIIKHPPTLTYSLYIHTHIHYVSSTTLPLPLARYCLSSI